MNGLSLADAALTYAMAGWYVLPTDPRDIKNPGSIVKGHWRQQSSRDFAQIRRWWTDNPNAGIALHVGRSGALAFDLDLDDMAAMNAAGYGDLASALTRTEAIGGTRKTGDRGHYIFAMPLGESFGNSAGAFARFGQVRGRNGVIIAAPTPHPDAPTKGGHYHQKVCGQPGVLGDVLLACLKSSATHADPMTPSELSEFLNRPECGRDIRPRALKGQLTSFADKIKAGESRHDSMCSVLVWAFREALVGCYPARRAYDELSAAFSKAKPDADAGEFDRIACWAAAQAQHARVKDTLDKLDRDVWPNPGTPLLVAQRFKARTEKRNQPIVFWRGDFWQWITTHWRQVSSEAMDAMLSEVLGAAYYRDDKGELHWWNPTTPRINAVMDRLRAISLLDSDTTPPTWLDRQGDRVVACTNGLVRLSDRMVLAHTPDYFNTFSLPFAYESRAPIPQRWLKFLKEVFPDDTQSAETLQEWFGYVLSGRTDLQKMLMVIGPRRSGKGTIDRVLTELVGKQARESLTTSAMAGDYGLSPLVGKTLAVFSDERVAIKGKTFVGDLLRITGEDPVSVNRKFKDPMSVQLSVRFMFMSNEIPMLPDNSGAIVSRMIALSTPESFLGREEIGLIDTLRAELPGILNWALDGMARLTKRGYFIQPASGAAIIELLSGSASPIQQFVADTCEFGDHDTHFVSKTTFYEHWKTWCADHGHYAGADMHFARALYAAYGNRIRGCKRGPRGDQFPAFSGIKVKARRLVMESTRGQSWDWTRQ
ncbi:phage/plasmid primase, P4 family [Mycolicibacterium elephantis]